MLLNPKTLITFASPLKKGGIDPWCNGSTTDFGSVR